MNIYIICDYIINKYYNHFLFFFLDCRTVPIKLLNINGYAKTKSQYKGKASNKLSLNSLHKYNT